MSNGNSKGQESKEKTIGALAALIREFDVWEPLEAKLDRGEWLNDAEIAAIERVHEETEARSAPFVDDDEAS